MSLNDDKQTIIFPVSSLYIQLDTNTGPNGESKTQLFKRGMIKMPKMDTPLNLTSEFPLFTKNVRYPRSIENESWNKKYEFFFNRDIFIERLRNHVDKSSESYKESITSKESDADSDKLYKWSKETEMNNIMITLRSIFPIPEVFGKALKNSFQHILKQESNSRVIWDVDVRNSLNIFGFMYKFGIANKEKEDYFINIDGKRFTVDDVVWENDLINHPIYNKFLMAQRETYEEVSKSVNDVGEKYSNYAYDLIKDLVKELEEKKEKEKKKKEKEEKEKEKEKEKTEEEKKKEEEEKKKAEENEKKSQIELLKINVEGRSKDIDSRSFGGSDRIKVSNEIIKKLEFIINIDPEWIKNNISKVAETFITIEEYMSDYAKSIKSSSKPSRIFMDGDSATYYDKMLDKSVKVNASSRVYSFARELIPLKLSNKNVDGTDITPIATRINKYIEEYFPTETSINNNLVNSVNLVYEPNRKTSNKKLYDELKQFKFGISSESSKEQSNIFEKIYNKYISMKHITFDADTNNKMEECIYTGVDEVKPSSSDNTKESNEPKIKRNVQEVYVRLDLVNADSLEKVNRSSCKLLDKDLEQELTYLIDPRNKESRILSRFRNLDFESVIPNAISNTMNENDSVNKKKNGGSRRVRNGRKRTTSKIRK
jgi:hypothetical protein